MNNAGYDISYNESHYNPNNGAIVYIKPLEYKYQIRELLTNINALQVKVYSQHKNSLLIAAFVYLLKECMQEFHTKL